jgi:hypothetical protein
MGRLLRFTVAAVALLLSAILVGCTGTTSSTTSSASGGGFISQEAVDKEYADPLGRLAFPPSFPPTSSLPRPVEMTGCEHPSRASCVRGSIGVRSVLRHPARPRPEEGPSGSVVILGK